MYKQFYAGMSYADLPLFALLFFFGVFVVVVLRQYLVKRKSDYDDVARLPLEPDLPVPPVARERSPQS